MTDRTSAKPHNPRRPPPSPQEASAPATRAALHHRFACPTRGAALASRSGLQGQPSSDAGRGLRGPFASRGLWSRPLAHLQPTTTTISPLPSHFCSSPAIRQSAVLRCRTPTGRETDRTPTPPSTAPPCHDPGSRGRNHCVRITTAPPSPKFHGDRGNLPGAGARHRVHKRTRAARRSLAPADEWAVAVSSVKIPLDLRRDTDGAVSNVPHASRNRYSSGNRCRPLVRFTVSWIGLEELPDQGSRQTSVPVALSQASRRQPLSQRARRASGRARDNRSGSDGRSLLRKLIRWAASTSSSWSALSRAKCAAGGQRTIKRQTDQVQQQENVRDARTYLWVAGRREPLRR